MKSDDALDRPRPRGKLSKAAKRTYAQEKCAEELLIPPKGGLAPFLLDPSILPKRPPRRSE